MPRTSWQDLLDAPAAPPPGAPSTGTPTAGAPDLGAIPGSLDDVPELRELLAERRRLEETLAAFTGQGPRPADEGRDARRFPVEPPSTPEERMQLRRTDRMEERAREEERRAFEVESLRRRRDEATEEERRASLVDRAARRRSAGEERVVNARDAWARHEQELLAARDRARDEARERGTVLPGADVLERVGRGARAVRGLLERVNRPAAGDERPRRDEWGTARDAAREAARWAEEELGDTQAGRTLRTLREVLDPPPERPLPDYTRAPGVDPMELRRLRALAALRERRAEEEPAARRRDAEPPPEREEDAASRPRAESAPRRRDDDAPRRRRDDDDAPRARRGEDDGTRSRRENDDAPRARRGEDDAPRARRSDDGGARGRREDDDAPRARRNDDAPRARDDDSRRARADQTRPRAKAEDDGTRRRARSEEAPRRRRDEEERPRRKRTDDDEPRRRRAAAEA